MRAACAARNPTRWKDMATVNSSGLLRCIGQAGLNVGASFLLSGDPDCGRALSQRPLTVDDPQIASATTKNNGWRKAYS